MQEATKFRPIPNRNMWNASLLKNFAGWERSNGIALHGGGVIQGTVAKRVVVHSASGFTFSKGTPAMPASHS